MRHRAGARTAAPGAVLVLGDSLAAAHNIPVESGWVHLLGTRLGKMVPKWTVVNASVSGETSLSGRNRLPTLLGKYRPRVLVLELGANDGLRGLPLPACAPIWRQCSTRRDRRMCACCWWALNCR